LGGLKDIIPIPNIAKLKNFVPTWIDPGLRVCNAPSTVMVGIIPNRMLNGHYRVPIATILGLSWENKAKLLVEG